MAAASPDEYPAFLDAAPDGFCLLDSQDCWVVLNDQYCAWLGRERAELLGRPFTELDANPAATSQALAQARAAGAGQFELQQRTRAGSLRHLEASAAYNAAQGRLALFLRDITARHQAEATLRQRTHDLGERVKELRCLLDLSTLFAAPDLTLAEVLHRAVDLLPPAWQYPEITAAQLAVPGLRYATPGFQPTPWRLTSALDLEDGQTGQIEVVYLEARPAAEHGPFLREEQWLLEAVAQRLSAVIRRRHIADALLLREMSLNSLLDLSQRASQLQERDIIQLALEEAERLTSSEIAYLHFVNADQNSIQLFTWSRRTLEQCTAAHDAHYPLAQAGVWADCARWKRPVVHNDYQSYPDRKGYPAGHAHLIRHVSVPVVEDGQVRVILGVGNKPRDYNAADTRQLLLTAEHLWRIVRRRRAEEEARRESERVATLAQVAARLNAQLELPAVLQTVCAATAQALGFPAASVYLRPGDALELAAASDLAAAPADLAARLEAGPWEDDLLHLPNGGDGWAGPVAAARLVHAGQALGVLAVLAPRAPRPWSPEDAALLRGLAHQAAQAITNARLFAEVSQGREQLRALSRRLVEVQESERRHIARELHDEVGQVLTAVKINLQGLRRQAALAALAPRLDADIDSVQRALGQVRNLSLDLRPSILDDLGLGAALEWYAQRLAQAAGLELELTTPAGAPRWPPEIEITCFRVAQEALTNILRHAQARRVWIELAAAPAEVRVQIRDDGQGFDPIAARERAARSGASVGLLGMAERVALAGGELTIASEPGQGTRVLVRFASPASH